MNHRISSHAAFVPLATFVLGLAAGSALTASARLAAGTPSETPPARASGPVGRVAAPSGLVGQTAPAVTGIGGVFFKADDPEALRGWYREHLDIDAGSQGADFVWRLEDDPERLGRTVWSVFPAGTDYFGDGGQEYMVNYRVSDLDGLLARLREAGVRQVGGTERYPYGSFAWVLDGEGNRVELWEPVEPPGAGP